MDSRSVGSPALASGRLYAFTIDGLLRIFDAANGTTLSTIALSAYPGGFFAWSSPIAAGGWVFVSDGTGAVRALQGVLTDSDADGDLDDFDCAPANPTVNHNTTEAIPILGGTLGVCDDGVDNGCDGVVDLDCAVDLDPSSQIVNPGVIVSGSVLDLRATSSQSPTTYEVLAEAGSTNGKKLTAIWSVATPNYSLQTFDLVVEAFHNASANNDFTFSYVKKNLGESCDSGWIASGPTITATSDTNTTQKVGIGTLANNLVCIRVQDTGSGSDSQADPLTLDRVYLFPTVTCADADGDGYTTSCSNCYRPTCPVLDCDDADAQKSPGVVEGPVGYPTCSDGKDNNCNGLIDAADLQACAPPPPSVLASADVATGPGQVITPDYTSTQETDDFWEVFEETTAQNKSKLTHTWRFDNVPNGSNHTLRLEAHRTSAAFGADDDFQFSWSTSPTSGFTDIPGALINHPVENIGGQLYPFGAAGVSGTIYIRAKSIGISGSGNGTHLDRLYVDFMVIHTDP